MLLLKCCKQDSELYMQCAYVRTKKSLNMQFFLNIKYGNKLQTNAYIFKNNFILRLQIFFVLLKLKNINS